jgi:hypothetical protein
MVSVTSVAALYPDWRISSASGDPHGNLGRAKIVRIATAHRHRPQAFLPTAGADGVGSPVSH